MDPPSDSDAKLLPIAVAFEGGLGVGAILLGWLRGQSPWSAISWSFAGLTLGLAATLPLLAAFFLLIRARATWCVRLRETAERLILPLLGQCGVGELGAISMLAGFAEELLFRGVIQAALGDWFSPAVGLVGASLVFGLAHPISLSYFTLVTVVGLYLGGIWLWTGNLLVPIVAHAVYDFVVLAWMARGWRAEAPPERQSV
jgi:membrane protease YdiL (CAAX protease family)